MDYEQFKRIMDIFLAISLGVIFLPISLIVALAIKLESPEGPVFADIPKELERTEGLSGCLNSDQCTRMPTISFRQIQK